MMVRAWYEARSQVVSRTVEGIHHTLYVDCFE